MNIRWYNDQDAQMLHKRVEEFIKPMCERLIPGHSYTHMGIHRNDHTNEVIIKLHLRPKFEAAMIDDRLGPLKIGRTA